MLKLLLILVLFSLLESTLVQGWGFVRLSCHRQKESTTFLLRMAATEYDDFAEWKGLPFISLSDDSNGDCGEDCEDCLIPDHYKIDPLFEKIDVLAYLGIRRVQSIERSWQWSMLLLYHMHFVFIHTNCQLDKGSTMSEYKSCYYPRIECVPIARETGFLAWTITYHQQYFWN